MMLDAPVFRGNSGSPVLSESGEVVAVVYATVRTEVEGGRKKVGLAVPVADFAAQLDPGSGSGQGRDR